MPYRSHFSALTALADALRQRGHHSTFFQQCDARRLLDSSAPDFVAVGQTTHPPGRLALTTDRAANPRSLRGLRRVIDDMAETTAMLCAELPSALQSAKVDALVVDQMEPAGALVAERLGLPYVSIACALPVNRAPDLPLPVMPFAYKRTPLYGHIYAGSTTVYDRMMTPHARVIEQYARTCGLPPRSRMDQCLSPRLQLSQTTSAFDLPRDPVEGLHHLGPFRRARAGSPFPPLRETRAKPLVFASFGTLQGHRFGLFSRIAQACRAAGCDLLIAHCGRLSAGQAVMLKEAGATWVLDSTDQLAALALADVVITHGGLNTVMDAIATRTPMLVLPLAFDQPGVACRVVHHGLGVQLNPRLASASRIARHLRHLLQDKTIEAALARQQQALAAAGGAGRGAELIEAACSGDRA